MEAVYELSPSPYLPVGDHFEEFNLDHTAVNYLMKLLVPYGMALDQATSVESVLAWVDAVYPPALAATTKQHINRAIRDTQLETLVPVTMVAIEALAGAILAAAVPLKYDYSIMPWEIKAAIVSTPGLQAMFQLDATNTLPVTVQLGDKRFEHLLTQDFVAGLQDYYWAAGDRITVFIAGEVLQHYASQHEDGFIDERPHFIVGLAVTDEDNDTWPPEDRVFDTPDYLRGMATAAHWLGEDVHTRVTNLRYIDDRDHITVLTF
jgi:hypothetical protein